jgi:hypothetical protein
MITEEKLTIIFNGRYEDETKSNIFTVKKILPKSEIILSTYKVSKKDNKFFKKYNIKLIINNDIGDYKEFPDNPKNLLRMMSTFYNGLQVAKNSKILRLRTDYSLKPSFKNCLKKIRFKRFNLKYKNQSKIIENIYTTNIGFFYYENFHFSDQVIIGSKAMLKKIYFINKQKFLKESDFSKLPKINGKWGSRLSSEQIIWINFLKNLFNVEDAYLIYKNLALHKKIYQEIQILDNNFFIIPPRLYNIRIKLRNYVMNNNNYLAYLLKKIYFFKNKKKKN